MSSVDKKTFKLKMFSSANKGKVERWQIAVVIDIIWDDPRFAKQKRDLLRLVLPAVEAHEAAQAEAERQHQQRNWLDRFLRG